MERLIIASILLWYLKYPEAKFVKTKNYNLEWKEINKEKVIKFLVDEHDFSLERVEKLVSKETTKSKNEGLNKWFK